MGLGRWVRGGPARPVVSPAASNSALARGPRWCTCRKPMHASSPACGPRPARPLPSHLPSNQGAQLPPGMPWPPACRCHPQAFLLPTMLPAMHIQVWLRLLGSQQAHGAPGCAPVTAAAARPPPTPAPRPPAPAAVPGRALMQGDTVTPSSPRQDEGLAVLTMPDGTKVRPLPPSLPLPPPSTPPTRLCPLLAPSAPPAFFTARLPSLSLHARPPPHLSPQVEFPVLLDSNGAKFIDIRKLQPRWGDRPRGRRACGPAALGACPALPCLAAWRCWIALRCPARSPWRGPATHAPGPAAIPSRHPPNPPTRVSLPPRHPRHPCPAAAPESAPLTPALAPPPPASPQSRTSTATRAYCCIAGEAGSRRPCPHRVPAAPRPSQAHSRPSPHTLPALSGTPPLPPTPPQLPD